METESEKTRRSRDLLWEKRNFAAYSCVTSDTLLSLPQEMANCETGKHLKPERRGGEEHAASHLAGKHPLERERKFPALDVSTLQTQIIFSFEAQRSC